MVSPRWSTFLLAKGPSPASSVHENVVLTLGHEPGRAFLNGLVGESVLIHQYSRCRSYVSIISIDIHVGNSQRSM